MSIALVGELVMLWEKCVAVIFPRYEPAIGAGLLALKTLVGEGE